MQYQEMKHRYSASNISETGKISIKDRLKIIAAGAMSQLAVSAYLNQQRRITMSVSARWIAVGLITTNFGLLAGHAVAGQLPEGVKKPVGAQIDPVQKAVCRDKIKLYQQGSRLEINGKDYICTMNNGWVLAPA